MPVEATAPVEHGACDDVVPREVDYALQMESEPPSIPTVSEWGMVAMAFLLLSAAILVNAKRRAADFRTVDR
jgi:hypothetical protein